VAAADDCHIRTSTRAATGQSPAQRRLTKAEQRRCHDEAVVMFEKANAFTIAPVKFLPLATLSLQNGT
jgi:hypothetical protein